MSEKTEIAVDLFSRGFNCAQSVLESHIAEFDMPSETSRKIAAAFGAGVGYNNEICGAVSGALMVIGLKYGQFKNGDIDSKIKTYEVTNVFVKKFKEKFGSVKCTELVKYNLSHEDELIAARESGVFRLVCPELIKKAVEIVEELLIETDSGDSI